jgi:hypothetical protein
LSRLPKARRRLRLVPDFSSPQSRRGELCSSSPVPVCVPLVLSCFSRNNRRRVRVFRLKCAAGCQSFVLGFTPQLWCRFTSATAPPGFPSHGFPEFGSLSVRKDLLRRRFRFLRRAAVRPAAGPSVCLFSPSGSGSPQPALGFRAAVVFTSRRVPHWSLGHFSTESSTGAESSISHSSVRVLVRFSNLNQSLCYGPRASIIGFVYFRFPFSFLAVSNDRACSRRFRASILVYSCGLLQVKPCCIPESSDQESGVFVV